MKKAIIWIFIIMTTIILSPVVSHQSFASAEQTKRRAEKPIKQAAKKPATQPAAKPSPPEAAAQPSPPVLKDTSIKTGRLFKQKVVSSPANGAYQKPKVTVRIKDLAKIQGTNTNQLIGYGLITGLRGTGDRTKTISNIMLKNMFEKLGIKIEPKELKKLQTKNAAVVMVTAELPASFRSGDTIDVTVSSVGDANSLEGGVLVLSVLHGLDGQIYASAQGPLTVGIEGAGARGRGKSKALVGRIPGGGLICRDMDVNLVRGGKMTWVIRHPDANTVTRVAKAINRHFHRSVARAKGNRFVIVDITGVLNDPAAIAAKIGELEVVPDTRARVVVNERTGTVVMGSEVKILPVAISHGNLTLRVVEDDKNAAPDSGAPTLDKGKTVRTERFINIGGDATVRDVIDVLNYIGAHPNDIITILQALKRAGALQGELEII